MTKQKSKKLNNNQKTITIICIAVIAILAVCATFAWFTNRVSFMNGKLTIGKLDYSITVYDKAGAQEFTKNYTTEEDVTAANNAETTENWASDKCMYKIVKVANSSGIGLKPYASIDYTIDGTGAPTSLANYFYYKSIDVTSLVENAGSVASFASTYTWPDIKTIADEGNSFGRIKNNCTLLGSVDTTKSSYYVIAYGCYNLPSDYLNNDYSVTVKPMLSLSQINGPIPNATGTGTQIYYASSWQTFNQIAAKAADGDTIFLTASVESPSATNLSLANGVNLNLNGYALTIHGDLAFDYKSTDNRYLTVPNSSKLAVEGNLIVNSSGPFTISGTASNSNIVLGKAVKNNGETTVTGGHFYVNCGLSVAEGSKPYETANIKEASGFTLSSVSVVKVNTTGGTALSDIEVSGSHTMIKVGSGAMVNSVVALAHPLTSQSTTLSDIYVCNYGKIKTSIDLSTVTYTGSLAVGIYVKNYNSVKSVYLPSVAKGYKTLNTTYNTRIVNAPGSDSMFDETNVFINGALVSNSGNFRIQDIEPYSASSSEQSTVVKTGDGEYTVNLKNTELNGTERITDLFNQFSFNTTDVKSLKISTYNGIRLSTEQFANISVNIATGADSFANMSKVDLSSAAVQRVNDVSTIPSRAFLNNTHLKTIVLPLTDVAIGSEAFQGTGISKITLGSNITDIGTKAFDVSGKLAVTWESATAITSDELLGFDSDKTTIFMDKSLVSSIKESGNYKDYWKLNCYEYYDFKSGDFYCKYSRNGTTTTGCEIIFYSGDLSAFDDSTNSNGRSLIPSSLADNEVSYNVISVNQQAYRKAILADAGVSKVNLTFPASCVSVENDAFEASESVTLNSNIISLNRVSRIGNNAFRYNKIAYSSARSSFEGMSLLGSYAFGNTEISGGVLDLHGVNDKSFSPSNNALSSLIFYGSTTDNPNYPSQSANAYLNLSNCNAISSTFAEGMLCKADINLKGTNVISANAFMSTIVTDADNVADMVNVIDLTNVSSIASNAFYGISCKQLILGSSLKLSDNSYATIVGATGALGIGSVKLTGYTPAVSGTNYMISSVLAGDAVQIGNVEIASSCKEVSNGAFSTNAAKVGTDNDHLKIGSVTIDERTEKLRLGDNAFKGVLFTSAEAYDFSGVTSVGQLCFAYSSITSIDLGDDVAQIDNADFIKGCTNLVSLINTYNGVNALGGTASESLIANAKLRITVLTDRLLDYIAESSTWYGWRNYFVAQEYSGKCTTAGAESPTGEFVWYYRIIDPTDAAKGVQIIRFDYSGTNTGNLGTITVPSSLGGFTVTEFGGEGCVFATMTETHYINYLKFVNSIKYIDPDSLDTKQIRAMSAISPASTYYYIYSNCLYAIVGKNASNQDMYDLVRVLPYNTYSTLATSPRTVTVKSGAMKNCKNQKKFTARDTTTNIEANAFEGCDNLLTVDLSAQVSQVVTIGNNVFGEARNRVMGQDGYYHYQPKSSLKITVPDALYNSYVANPSYYMYANNGNILKSSESSSVSSYSVSSALNTVKKIEQNVNINSINYHIMNSGMEFNGVQYSDKTTDFVAVVSSLSSKNVKDKTIVVPSVIVVKGVSYKVVGIDDKAFGANNYIEKIVLPNKSVQYSSVVFAQCENLGYIQYNDSAPYSDTANAVATTPPASSASLIQDSSKKDDKE